MAEHIATGLGHLLQGAGRLTDHVVQVGAGAVKGVVDGAIQAGKPPAAAWADERPGRPRAVPTPMPRAVPTAVPRVLPTTTPRGRPAVVSSGLESQRSESSRARSERKKRNVQSDVTTEAGSLRSQSGGADSLSVTSRGGRAREATSSGSAAGSSMIRREPEQSAPLRPSAPVYKAEAPVVQPYETSARMAQPPQSQWWTQQQPPAWGQPPQPPVGWGQASQQQAWGQGPPQQAWGQGPPQQPWGQQPPAWGQPPQQSPWGTVPNPTQTMVVMDEGELLNQAKAEATSAAQYISLLQEGDPSQRMRATLVTLKSKLGSLVYNCQEDLFAWTRCWGGECFFQEGTGGYWTAFVMLLMLFLYGFGIALFFVHLQYMTHCNDGLTTISKAKETGGNLTSCEGWASECKLHGTTLFLKDYLQYRAAAYVLLLIPFMYIPFMAITFVNQSVSDIVTMLVDTMETNRDSESVVQIKSKLEAERDRYKAMQTNRLSAEDMGVLMRGILRRMDRDGHSSVLLLLVFLFHGLMGGVSLYYDGSLFVTVDGFRNDDNKKCERYQNRLYEMAKKNEVSLDLKFLAMWSMLVGIGTWALTAVYLLVQCRTVMLRHNENANTHAIQKRDNNEEIRLRNVARDGHVKTVVENLQNKLQNKAKEIGALRNAGEKLFAMQQVQQQGQGQAATRDW